jgi:hypothetical protein
MAKNKSYLQRVSQAAYAADATAELSPEALAALASNDCRMDVRVFRELQEKGYILPAKRAWSYAPKAEAYRNVMLKKQASENEVD